MCMKKSNKNRLLAILESLILLAFAACSAKDSLDYDQISGAEAKAIMDSESGYIIIDARTQSEYDEGHIPGAIMIPE